MRPELKILFFTLLLSGCLYANIRSPRAYRSATPSDVHTSAADEIASGQSCSQIVLYLVGWGDAGYAAAVQDALKDKKDAILYDVRTDIKVNSYVLGLYSKACTIVTGKVGKL